MKRKPTQRQEVTEICREELEAANLRIAERLAAIEARPAGVTKDGMESIRRLYEDLADKKWTESDEECLAGLAESSQPQIKSMVREAFRHSPVIPVPSFRYLVSLAKKMENEPPRAPVPSNPDAFSAFERERLANLLAEELQETAETIIKRLDIDDGKGSIVRQVLQDAQGTIVSHSTPLV